MKAKDSAMTDLVIIRHISEWVRGGGKDVADLAMAVRDDQAEISFKAGIKEVVDWLINDSYDTTIHFGEDWQVSSGNGG